jgi:hypothetical protein
MPHSARVRIRLEIFNGPSLEVAQCGAGELILRDRYCASPDTLAWLVIDIDDRREHKIVALTNGLRGEEDEKATYLELESKGLTEDGFPILQAIGE